MRISVLAENTAFCPEAGFEHGLSLFVETEGADLLFDMGQTSLFADNAALLGVDLSKTDIAVLSHGHYDHGGGLKKFLEINGRAKVYLSKYAFEEHYNALGKYIGLDESLKNNCRFKFVNGITHVSNNITIFGGKGEKPLDTLGAKGMQTMGENGLEPDDFSHEQYLLIEENGKRILFSGCSHRGAAEIRDYFEPDVFIGGFHFSKVDVSDETGQKLLRAEAEKLLRGNTVYLTCHCTGTEQFEFLKQIMGEKLYYISGGDRVDIDSVLGK